MSYAVECPFSFRRAGGLAQSTQFPPILSPLWRGARLNTDSPPPGRSSSRCHPRPFSFGMTAVPGDDRPRSPFWKPGKDKDRRRPRRMPAEDAPKVMPLGSIVPVGSFRPMLRGRSFGFRDAVGLCPPGVGRHRVRRKGVPPRSSRSPSLKVPSTAVAVSVGGKTSCPYRPRATGRPLIGIVLVARPSLGADGSPDGRAGALVPDPYAIATGWTRGGKATSCPLPSSSLIGVWRRVPSQEDVFNLFVFLRGSLLIGLPNGLK